MSSAVATQKKLEAYLRKHPDTNFFSAGYVFGCPSTVVSKLYFRLFPEMKGKNRFPTYYDPKYIDRDRTVTEAVIQNPDKRYSDLAQELGVTTAMVSVIARGQGVVRGQGQGRRRESEDQWNDLDHPRNKLLRQSLEENWTLEETGKALGLTRERARQLRDKYERIHGKVSTPWLTIEEVAHRLGVGVPWVRKTIEKHELGRPRGLSFVFREEDLSNLRDKIMLDRRRTCEVCKKTVFIPDDQRLWWKYCSPECRTQYDAFILRMRKPVKSADNCRVWGGLIKMLPDPRPEETTYVTGRIARNMTGVSTMQLIYLREKQIIRTSTDPRGLTRLGTPYKVYALSDIRILQKFMRQKNKK